jgi:hypothetical protein
MFVGLLVVIFSTAIIKYVYHQCHEEHNRIEIIEVTHFMLPAFYVHLLLIFLPFVETKLKLVSLRYRAKPNF